VELEAVKTDETEALRKRVEELEKGVAALKAAQPRQPRDWHEGESVASYTSQNVYDGVRTMNEDDAAEYVAMVRTALAKSPNIMNAASFERFRENMAMLKINVGGAVGANKALWASGDKLLSGERYDGGITGPYDGKNPFARLGHP
jgi:hypothetical protein